MTTLTNGSVSELIRQQQRTLDVALDLDGCFFLFDRGYWTGCVTIGAIQTPYVPAQRWEFYEDYGHTLEDFLRNCNQLADLGLLWDQPLMPGAGYAWDVLADAGHRIHVKTDRSFGAHPVVSQVGTRMVLRQHRLRFESITFTADKTAGPACDIMLEDKLADYDAVAATTCQPFLINRDWNRVPGDDRRRVNTHDEFVRAVLELAAQSASQD